LPTMGRHMDARQHLSCVSGFCQACVLETGAGLVESRRQQMQTGAA
jgi:hypothetical protein